MTSCFGIRTSPPMSRGLRAPLALAIQAESLSRAHKACFLARRPLPSLPCVSFHPILCSTSSFPSLCCPLTLRLALAMIAIACLVLPMSLNISQDGGTPYIGRPANLCSSEYLRCVRRRRGAKGMPMRGKQANGLRCKPFQDPKTVTVCVCF